MGRPSKGASVFDLLSDDLIIEIFMRLPQFPHLLRVRQVCTRWHRLTYSPRLWISLSFEGHEHVLSYNLSKLCESTPFELVASSIRPAIYKLKPTLRRLRHLSLAKVHGVNEHAVRSIPRTDCANTLESVDLSWCSGATDKSVVEFSRCPRLRELRLSHCREVTRRSVRILAVRCPSLEVLDMNCIGGLRDSLLSIIGQNCPYLRVLNIANGKHITDEGVAHIAKGCPKLEVLDLSWCVRVTDGAVSTIANNVPEIKDIGLSETKVTNVGLIDLTRGCSKLEAIHLARCIHVTDDGVDSIITHCSPRLKSLNLASCEDVSDRSVERLIKECPNLECLDVSKLPCRKISGMLERLTASRNIQVYY